MWLLGQIGEVILFVVFAVGILAGIALLIGGIGGAALASLWLTWVFFTKSSAITITSVLAVIYSGIGFSIQRRTFRIKINHEYGSGSYHRRKVPDPTVPLWQRLATMFLWGLPALGGILWFIGGDVAKVSKITYRVMAGDTWPTKEPPPREILPPEVRERRRVRLGWPLGAIFSFGVLVSVVAWFFTEDPVGKLILAQGFWYLLYGVGMQRHVHRVKVGSSSPYATSHRRKIPDPQVSLWQRLATVFFWGVEIIPLDFLLIWEEIISGTRIGYRWVVGDTQPTEPIPSREILFPDEQRTKEVVGAGSSKN